jgi:hypothetical protein
VNEVKTKQLTPMSSIVRTSVLKFISVSMSAASSSESSSPSELRIGSGSLDSCLFSSSLAGVVLIVCKPSRPTDFPAGTSIYFSFLEFYCR